MKCQTTENQSGGTSTDVVIPIQRDGSVEVATLSGGFRYAVSEFIMLICLYTLTLAIK